MNWYLEVLKKYAVFNGRARRKEYWYFLLFNILISIALALIDRVTGSFDSDAGVGLLGGIYALAVLIPGIAVSVRRLHDTGRSGWWLLIGLVPFIGAIVLLVFMVSDSQPGQNQYDTSRSIATKTKVIIGVCVALLSVGLLFILAMVGIGLYVSSDKDFAKLHSDALAEGAEFGKKTDQMGCLQEGFARLESVSEPSISQLTANDAFLGECLAASRPNAGFCDKVPLFPYSEWIEGECNKLGRTDAVCRGVFDAKHGFCNF